jgi:hypothetical protein
VNEFNLLSRAEKIAWCNARLRHYDELEAQIRRAPYDPAGAEALQEIAVARQAILKALKTVERPTLWQRINFAVNSAAANDVVREDVRRRNRPDPCSRCGGTGRVGGAGNWFEACGSCATHVPNAGSAEVELAKRAAAQRRREMGR